MLLAAASQDGTLSLWDCGQPLTLGSNVRRCLRVRAHEGPARAVAFVPAEAPSAGSADAHADAPADGRVVLASAGADGSIALWRLGV